MAEAAALAGLPLEQTCGGRGQCGRCRVVIRSPAPPLTPAERGCFSLEEMQEGWRLACQVEVSADLVVEIPARSLAVHKAKILAEHLPIVLNATDWPLRKVRVRLRQDQEDAPRALVERLKNQLGDISFSLELLQKLSSVDEASATDWTAVVECDEALDPVRQRPLFQQANECQGWEVLPGQSEDTESEATPAVGQGGSAYKQNLLDLLSGDHTASVLAVAFDIGTTTLVAHLVDLVTGQRLAVASEINPQIRFGEDVISRIQYARDHRDGTSQLQQAVLKGCTQIAARLCRQAGVASTDVYLCSFAGNTTMLHLLLGLDVRRLGEAPFTPVFRQGLTFRGHELGLPFHPQCQVYILPVIGPFVGGDTVAGMLAVRLWERPGPALLVDIGTNGEIALSHRGELYAAATAAGPAFEGVRIHCGMRAVAGAIERIEFSDGQLRWQVIGNQVPTGICGSGIVDLVAELLRLGIVSANGRMLSPRDVPPVLPQALRERLQLVDERPAFVMVPADLSASGQPLVFTQQDVRQVQLAAGAIRAGVNVLCGLVGVKPEDIEEVWIAGAFGNFLRPESAQRIGLLPRQIPLERIHFAGNTSLAGATLAVASVNARRQAEWLADCTRHIDLAAQPEFRHAFAEGMIFPEFSTD